MGCEHGESSSLSHIFGFCSLSIQSVWKDLFAGTFGLTRLKKIHIIIFILNSEQYQITWYLVILLYLWSVFPNLPITRLKEKRKHSHLIFWQISIHTAHQSSSSLSAGGLKQVWHKIQIFGFVEKYESHKTEVKIIFIIFAGSVKCKWKVTALCSNCIQIDKNDNKTKDFISVTKRPGCSTLRKSEEVQHFHKQNYYVQLATY